MLKLDKTYVIVYHKNMSNLEFEETKPNRLPLPLRVALGAVALSAVTLGVNNVLNSPDAMDMAGASYSASQIPGTGEVPETDLQ